MLLSWIRRPAGASAAPTTAGLAQVPAATASPGAVIVAESAYARAVLRAVGGALLVAALLVGAQVGMSAAMSIDPEASISLVPLLDAGGGGIALVLLIPLSIALQVLIRIPRDPETTAVDDAAARRQFWGDVSAAVAVASGYVGLSTLLHGVVSTGPVGEMDLALLFGIPVGAGVTMLVAADAAALTRLESERLNLDHARRDAEIRRARAAVDSISGRPRRHPVRDLIVRGIAVATLATVVGTGIVSRILPGGGAAVVFAVFALILALLTCVLSVDIVGRTLRGRILEVVLVTPAGAAAGTSIVLQAFAIGIDHRAGDEYGDYAAALAYAALVAAPAVLTLLALAVPRGRGGRTAPLLDVGRMGLERQIARLRRLAQPSRPPAPWRGFAVAAVALSLVPPVALTLAAAATWHRRAEAPRVAMPPLLAWAWTAPLLVAAASVVALLLLPLYGAAWGWFAPV